MAAEDEIDEDDAGWGLGAAAAAQPARVLSQAEIDSLLGDADIPQDHGEQTGIQRIVDSGLVSYERLPMLEIVFDRLVRSLSSSLRNFTSDNVEVEIDNIQSLRFGNYLNSLPLPAMLAVFKAEEWDNYGLLVIDSALIYSIVDVLLGGRQGSAIMRIEGRPYTTIERTLIERLITVFLAELGTSFEPLTPVTFRFERLEVNPRFAAISRLSNAAVPHALAGRHGGPWRPPRTFAAVCDTGAGTRTAPAAVHGRAVRSRPDLGKPLGRRTLGDRGPTGSGSRRAGSAAVRSHAARGRQPNHTRKRSGLLGSAPLRDGAAV